MKVVSEKWEQAFPKGNWGPDLFEEFAMRAKKASAEVYRVKTSAEAQEMILNLVKFTNAKKAVVVTCPLGQAAAINDALAAIGVEVHTTTTAIATHAETADIGISGVEFAVAETGSVCQDAYSVESRLVSTLPPIHVAFLNSRNVLKGIEEAMDTISRVFDRGYVSFITGPSLTGDIERVHTIGMSGPGRFIVVAVDELVNGGAE